MDTNTCSITWIIAGLGLIALVGVFCRMKQGFGPNNLKAVGIVIVATFAALLATKDAGALTAGVGLLGSVAGYLFGSPKEKDDKSGGATKTPQ
jgi:hypothetical protein